MSTTTPPTSTTANPAKDLHIAIIGAGISGLSTALSLSLHEFTNIHIYEYAPDIRATLNVGAGIQLAPNMVRILDREFGCWKDVEKEAVDLEGTSIREGSTDDELRFVNLKYIRETYGHPHMVGHRSSLIDALYKACLTSSSITFHFSTAVETINKFAPVVSFNIRRPGKDGEGQVDTINADILLGADGIKSIIRTQLLSHITTNSENEAKIIDTGQAAYRILLTREQILSSPNSTSDSNSLPSRNLLSLLQTPSATRWIGPRKHIIAYPISSHQIYNISTAHPDVNFAKAPSSSYTTRASKAEVLKTFADFDCPIIKEMLDLVPGNDVCEWKLRSHTPLPTWVMGNVALVGDACHPMLPHLAQGAAMGVEDGWVLGGVFARGLDLNSSGDGEGRAKTINRCLKIYESLRKSRTELISSLAAESGRVLHLGEGKAKEERDKTFRNDESNPDKWVDKDIQKMIYGFDVKTDLDERWDGLWDGLS